MKEVDNYIHQIEGMKKLSKVIRQSEYLPVSRIKLAIDLDVALLQIEVMLRSINIDK